MSSIARYEAEAEEAKRAVDAAELVRLRGDLEEIRRLLGFGTVELSAVAGMLRRGLENPEGWRCTHGASPMGDGRFVRECDSGHAENERLRTRIGELKAEVKALRAQFNECEAECAKLRASLLKQGLRVAELEAVDEPSPERKRSHREADDYPQPLQAVERIAAERRRFDDDARHWHGVGHDTGAALVLRTAMACCPDRAEDIAVATVQRLAKEGRGNVAAVRERLSEVGR